MGASMHMITHAESCWIKADTSMFFIDALLEYPSRDKWLMFPRSVAMHPDPSPHLPPLILSGHNTATVRNSPGLSEGYVGSPTGLVEKLM